MWYVVSSINNIVGKIILSDFPYPMTVSFVQLISITVYSLPILKVWNIPKLDRSIPLKFWVKTLLPLAMGKVVASISAHISIWKVPVSYAHTVKATMPLFVVILSRVILKESQTKKVYISLSPIIGGVIIATLTELSFNITGLLSALSATMCFALLNIFSKKCLKETGMNHIRLLFILAVIALLILAPIWFFIDFPYIWEDSSLLHSLHSQRLVALLVIDGFCNFAQNLVAFTIIALVSPLSYAVANATKRIAIISFSLMTFRNPVSPANIIGMGMAIFGVLLYNKAKYDQNMAKKREAILPYVRSETNLNGGFVGGMNNGYMPHSVPDRTTSLLLQNSFVEERLNGDTAYLGGQHQNFAQFNKVNYGGMRVA